MAKKRTLDRRTLREQNEVAESREKDKDKEEVVEEEEEDAEEASADADDDGGDDDEDGPKKKKKKVVVKKKAVVAKKPAVKRTRTPKEVRMKAVWVVFDNGSKRVDTFPFNQKADAEALLAKKLEDKKTGFYMTMVKEPLD